MISLEGLLFSERRLWGWFWERGEVEKRDWEGGQKGETAVMMEYMRKELKTYKKNNNSNHISNVSLRVEIWIFSSRIRKYERCPLLSFLFRMEQRILERVTSEEKNTIYGNYKIKIFIYRWVSFVYKNCKEHISFPLNMESEFIKSVKSKINRQNTVLFLCTLVLISSHGYNKITQILWLNIKLVLGGLWCLSMLPTMSELWFDAQDHKLLLLHELYVNKTIHQIKKMKNCECTIVGGVYANVLETENSIIKTT